MTQADQDIVRRFLQGMSEGRVPDALTAPDMTAWTLSGGAASRERFVGGVAMLQRLFPDGLRYTPDAIIADGEHVAVQARSEGVFADGEPFVQHYMFLFRLVGGQVVAIREYNDTALIARAIMPRMQAMMAAGGAAAAGPASGGSG